MTGLVEKRPCLVAFRETMALPFWERGPVAREMTGSWPAAWPLDGGGSEAVRSSGAVSGMT